MWVIESVTGRIPITRASASKYPSGVGRGCEGLTTAVQAAAAALAGATQFQGSSSPIRLAGWSGSRANTSASQACGSMPFSFAVAIRLYMTAARSPPRFEPQNSHDLRPSATPRSARSAALFVKQTRPSSRKRVKVVQRLSM